MVHPTPRRGVARGPRRNGPDDQVALRITTSDGPPASMIPTLIRAQKCTRMLGEIVISAVTTSRVGVDGGCGLELGDRGRAGLPPLVRVRRRDRLEQQARV